MLESTSMKLSTLVIAGAVAATPEPWAMALCVVASLVQPTTRAAPASRPRTPNFALVIVSRSPDPVPGITNGPHGRARLTAYIAHLRYTNIAALACGDVSSGSRRRL